jgi:hypothetical protein
MFHQLYPHLCTGTNAMAVEATTRPAKRFHLTIPTSLNTDILHMETPTRSSYSEDKVRSPILKLLPIESSCCFVVVNVRTLRYTKHYTARVKHQQFHGYICRQALYEGKYCFNELYNSWRCDIIKRHWHSYLYLAMKQIILYLDIPKFVHIPSPCYPNIC